MTYCSDNANESATGRRKEIEITPEMIEAGADALCLFNLGEDRPEEIARELYRVMRLLEGRFAALCGEALSAHPDGLISPVGQSRADKQALAGERAAETIVRIVQ